MKTDLFRVLWPLLSFPNLLIFWVSAFTALSFRIWNSSTGIPSPPLTLFMAMLKPTWLHIPGCLAVGEWSHHCGYLDNEDHFCIVLLCILVTSSWYHLLVRSVPFLSFIVPIFAWNVPLVSLILLKRSLVFPILLFSSFLCVDRWGKLSFLSLLFFRTLHSNLSFFLFSFVFHFSSFFS